jgi:hypothetical protein
MEVNALGNQQFAIPLKSLQDLATRLSLDKDNLSQVIADKAARLAKMPTVPQFLAFLTEKLKRAVQYVRLHERESWEDYEICRNYILVALLFGVPPQRKQFLDTVDVDDITVRDKYSILTVSEHKTARRYGPIVVALPPYYYEDFKYYLDLRLTHALVSNNSLFIQRNGSRDKYLTRRFQQLTQDEFGIDVSIRDCRSIFVNYAKDKFDLKQLYELSRQMCHSFQMQQSQYRADDSVDRAIHILRSMNQITDLLPIANEETHDIQQLEDGSTQHGENDDTVDELAGELTDDQLMAFVEDYNSTHSDHDRI